MLICLIKGHRWGPWVRPLFFTQVRHCMRCGAEQER